MAIKFIENNEYKNEIPAKGVAVVNFFAEWCGPCQMFAEVLKELDAEGNVAVIKLDVDKNKEAAVEAKVSGIPASYIYKDGKLVKDFSGYLPLEALKSEIG